MTHEDIEAARDVLISIVSRSSKHSSWRANYDELQTALQKIDALCEAAKAARPESLVGRTVNFPLVKGELAEGTVIKETMRYDVDFNGWARHGFLRRDFELIEPTVGKEGAMEAERNAK